MSLGSPNVPTGQRTLQASSLVFAPMRTDSQPRSHLPGHPVREEFAPSMFPNEPGSHGVQVVELDEFENEPGQHGTQPSISDSEPRFTPNLPAGQTFAQADRTLICPTALPQVPLGQLYGHACSSEVAPGTSPNVPSGHVNWQASAVLFPP